MRSIILRGFLAATAALLTACSSSDSLGPAAASASAPIAVSADVQGAASTWQSIDQYVWVSCANGGAGETLHVTGELRYAVHRNQDAAGISHLNIKSNTSVLTAEALTSGASFRGTMAERVSSRAEDDLNMDVRTSDVIRFVANGRGESYSLMVSSRLIVNEGSYVVTEQSWKEVCL